MNQNNIDAERTAECDPKETLGIANSGLSKMGRRGVLAAYRRIERACIHCRADLNRVAPKDIAVVKPKIDLPVAENGYLFKRNFFTKILGSHRTPGVVKPALILHR